MAAACAGVGFEASSFALRCWIVLPRRHAVPFTSSVVRSMFFFLKTGWRFARAS